MTASKAHPAAVPLGDGIYRIACQFAADGIVHLYYIDSPEPVLVDTGVTATPERDLLPALSDVGLDLRAVRHIFTTHGHWDHMGGHGSVRAIAPRALIYIQPADAYLLDRLEAHTFGYITYMPRALDDATELRAVMAQMASNIVCPVRADVLVLDGHRIEIGGGRTIRAIHTPGHSRGSMSYFLEDAKTLFTGDAIQGLGGGVGRLPLVFDDSRAYRATIARVAGISPDRLCLGHAFSGLPGGTEANPVREGAHARQFLEESGQAAKAIEETMRRVIANGDGGFVVVAKTVLQRLVSDLGVTLDEHGLNRRAIATLHAFYRELTGSPPPI